MQKSIIIEDETYTLIMSKVTLILKGRRGNTSRISRVKKKLFKEALIKVIRCHKGDW